VGKPWGLENPEKWRQATHGLLYGSQVKVTGGNAGTEAWNADLGLRSRLRREPGNILVENINTHVILIETKEKV